MTLKTIAGQVPVRRRLRIAVTTVTRTVAEGEAGKAVIAERRREEAGR